MVNAAMKLKDACSLEVVTNTDSILKSRDITLPTKVHLVKAIVFPVVMYECESWTIKKAEPRRTDGFELWCWRRLLRVPWTARRYNQSILKVFSRHLLMFRLYELVLNTFSQRQYQFPSGNATVVLILAQLGLKLFTCLFKQM